eukprot:11126852-Lingulodinium_polyedra.AAC.1
MQILQLSHGCLRSLVCRCEGRQCTHILPIKDALDWAGLLILALSQVEALPKMLQALLDAGVLAIDFGLEGLSGEWLEVTGPSVGLIALPDVATRWA